jgi:hypothetical protein
MARSIDWITRCASYERRSIMWNSIGQESVLDTIPWTRVQ